MKSFTSAVQRTQNSLPLSPPHHRVADVYARAADNGSGQAELVLGFWELGEIDRELEELEDQLRHAHALRHPLVCLRIRQQVGALRFIRDEQCADLEELLAAN